MNINDCAITDSASYSKALFQLAKQQNIPIYAQFELTPRCNFNCEMCYIHMTESEMLKLGKELSTDEWLRLAREARDAGTLFLTLTGGEVFVRSDFRELYEKLSEMGFLLSIMTNASLIDDNVIKWLKKRPPYFVRITLYGSTNDVYRSVCGVYNGFDRVDHALGLLQDANIPIALKSVLIRNNENDVQNMFDYATKRNLRFQASYGINKPVRGAKSNAINVRRTQDTPPLSFQKVTVSEKKPGEKGIFRHHPNYLDDCGAYGSSFIITWDGHMTLCSFMDEPFVDVKSKNLYISWIELMKKINTISLPEKCTNCKYENYCMRCPGVLAAECGSYSKTSDAFCNRAKYLYSLYNTNVEI